MHSEVVSALDRGDRDRAGARPEDDRPPAARRPASRHRQDRPPGLDPPRAARLTDEEYEIVKRHPEFGHSLLDGMGIGPSTTGCSTTTSTGTAPATRTGSPARRSRSARGSSSSPTPSRRSPPTARTARRSRGQAALDELRANAGAQFDPEVVHALERPPLAVCDAIPAGPSPNGPRPAASARASPSPRSSAGAGASLGRLQLRGIALFYVAIGLAARRLPDAALPWRTPDRIAVVLWLVSYGLFALALLSATCACPACRSSPPASSTNVSRRRSRTAATCRRSRPRSAPPASSSPRAGTARCSRHPHLAWLVDRWAAPDWVPLGERLLGGDVLIAAGGLVFALGATGVLRRRPALRRPAATSAS